MEKRHTDTEAGMDQIYSWEVAQIGDESPPFVYEVTADKIADYCRAVRYENPVYVNDAAAREMGLPAAPAPAAMAYVYAPQRIRNLIAAKDRVAPNRSGQRSHGSDFISTRLRLQGVLVRPGDRITSVTRVVDKTERGDDRFITFGVTARNQRDERVAEYDCVYPWDL